MESSSPGLLSATKIAENDSYVKQYVDEVAVAHIVPISKTCIFFVRLPSLTIHAALLLQPPDVAHPHGWRHRIGNIN
jgi:hypothetical protein